MMNNSRITLCTDIGFVQVNKKGEELCGDHVEIVDNPAIAVLADGLGSGVKANILSTLTSKILSTMAARNMPIEECVSAVAATLPVCKERNIAYSTFTIIRIRDNHEAELVQYDNPQVILLRNGHNTEYERKSETICGKTIYKSIMPIMENDFLIALSDGAIHAGVGKKLNFGWQRENIITFLEEIYEKEYTAKTLSAILLQKCEQLYGGEPGDDTTVCTVKLRRRNSINLLIGPPSNPAYVSKMMALFFAKEGKHIVCGGTTSTLAAEYLGKPLNTDLPKYLDPVIPPTASIEGVDLVTEGVITFSKVLENAKDYTEDNSLYSYWHAAQNGASAISLMLFEEATDINFYVGRAINPAHQNPNLPINFSIKMYLVEELSNYLRKMGKQIKVSYF
jgi:hypothetical protein